MRFGITLQTTLYFDSDVITDAMRKLAAEHGTVIVKVQNNRETEAPEVVLLYEDDDCFQSAFTHTSAANETAKAFADWLKTSFRGLVVKTELLATEDNAFKMIHWRMDQ